jgi:hypothetical protein
LMCTKFMLSVDWKIYMALYLQIWCYLVILFVSLNVHMPAICLGSPLSLWSLTEHLACSSCNMNSQVQ